MARIMVLVMLSRALGLGLLAALLHGVGNTPRESHCNFFDYQQYIICIIKLVL